MYELKNENVQQEPLDVKWFRQHRSAGRSEFCNSREVTKRLLLEPGNYVIVPCTFQPQEESAFVLRIFTEKKQGKQIDVVGNRFLKLSFFRFPKRAVSSNIYRRGRQRQANHSGERRSILPTLPEYQRKRLGYFCLGVANGTQQSCRKMLQNG